MFWVFKMGNRGSEKLGYLLKAVELVVLGRAGVVINRVLAPGWEAGRRGSTLSWNVGFSHGAQGEQPLPAMCSPATYSQPKRQSYRNIGLHKAT